LLRSAADDRKPVELRQHAIDDQHVVLAVKRERQALLAVGRAIGDMADLAERLDQIIGGVAVVLDDEKAHGRSPLKKPMADRLGGFVSLMISFCTVPPAPN
jgi:hypothetical protein